MTEQERINQQLQRQIDAQGARIDSVMVKLDSFIEESRAARTRQDAEMRELRQDMKNMDVKIDGIGKHVQNLIVAAIIGIGAAVAGIGAIAVTVIYSVLTR